MSDRSRERVRAAAGWPLQAFACFVALGLFWGTWAALLPSLQEQTGSSDAELGVALLAVAAGALPAMLASGRILDRLGDRALAPGTALFGATAVLPGLAHSPLALGAAAVAIGAASGTLDVAMNAVVAADEVRTGRRLMHAAHGVFSIGVVVAGASVGLARSAGADPLPVLAVIAGVLIAFSVALARPATEQPVRRGIDREPPPVAGRRLILTAPLLVLGGLCALAYLIEGALESWSAIHLEHTLGAGPEIGGLGPATFAAASALGRLGAHGIAGRMADRLLLSSTAGVCAVGTAVAAFAPSPLIALLGVFLAGAGGSVAAPTIFSVTGRIVAPHEWGRAMASVTTIAYLGFLLGPPMVGGIAGAATLRWGLAAVSAVALLLAALSRFAPRAPAA